MSLMTREDVLRELELLPVWQLRNPMPRSSTLAVEPAIPDLPAIESSVLEPVIAVEIDASVVEPQIVGAQSPEVSLPFPMLRLVSDTACTFLLSVPIDDSNATQVDVLFQNMLKAIQLTPLTDIPSASLQQLQETSSKLMVVMGESAANALFGMSRSLADWRAMQAEHLLDYESVPVIVTFHPEHLLAHPVDKAQAWRDLCRVKAMLHDLSQ